MKKLIGLLLGMTSSMACAQSTDQVDPQHFKLVFENECVRVVHAKFGAGERVAAPYQTRGSAVVALTDIKGERTTEDGQKRILNRKAGEAWWGPPDKVNSLVIDQPAEWITVVPKGKAGCEK